MFEVQNELKEEFLSTKPTGTSKDNRYVLKLVDKYESMLNKFVYDLSIGELKEMLSVQFKKSSRYSLKKNKAIISGYVSFCRNKGIVYHMENRIDMLTDDDLEDIIDKKAIQFKYTPYEKLKEYQAKVGNKQDKLLMELSYYGIRGRTIKEATLEEIINLRIDFDKIKSGELKENELILIKNNGLTRRLEVKPETMQLIYETYYEDMYYGNNKQEGYTNARNIVINKLKNFVFRTPGKNKFKYFDSNFINSRMARIQGWIGNDYVTITDLYFSGMINMAREILKKNDKVTIFDVGEICDHFEYSRAYTYKIKQKIEEYLGTEVVNE